MALKGFLASGFQKLIGASRIKGANDQWVGEPNVQAATFTGAFGQSQCSNTLVYGHNILEMTGTLSLLTDSSTPIFTNTPTFACLVTFINKSATATWRISTSGVAGGGSFQETLASVLNNSITLYYDTTSSRWREVSSKFDYIATTNLIVNNGATTIPLNTSASKIMAKITPGSSTAVADIVSVDLGFTSVTGNTLYIYGTSMSDALITLKESVVTGNLLINGDYSLSNNGMISLVWDGNYWREIGRFTR